MLRAVRRAVLPTLSLVAVTLLAGGCEDQRGPVQPASTGILDGESTFAIASFITTAYTMINDVASEILEAHDSGTPLPITIIGCSGGAALVTDNADGDPNTYRVTFSLYTAGCRDPLPLVIATDPDAGGSMILTFLETSPGLSYTVDFPYDVQTNQPVGITVQLPAEIGFEFALTTPFGPITYVLDGDRGTAGAELDLLGTLRWEDRGNAFNIVQELVLSYPMDESQDPPLAKYPLGAYQIAAWAQGVAGFPVNVGFTGDGGITYTVEGTTCNGDLATNFNPCEDL